MMIDDVAKKLYSTEYAVLKFGDNDKDNLFTIQYSIDSSGAVIATVSSTNNNVRFSIQITDTQRFGVTQ